MIGALVLGQIVMTKLTVKRDRDQDIETAIAEETIDDLITGHLQETTVHPPETTDHHLGTDQEDGLGQ